MCSHGICAFTSLMPFRCCSLEGSNLEQALCKEAREDNGHETPRTLHPHTLLPITWLLPSVWSFLYGVLLILEWIIEMSNSMLNAHQFLNLNTSCSYKPLQLLVFTVKLRFYLAVHVCLVYVCIGLGTCKWLSQGSPKSGHGQGHQRQQHLRASTLLICYISGIAFTKLRCIEVKCN